MIKQIIKLIILLLISGKIYSQTITKRIEDTGYTPSARGNSDGNINLKLDAKVFDIIDKQIKVNDDKSPGWRVQIYFGSGGSASQTAKDIQEKFKKEYGLDIGCYIVYEDPYFKVRAGDFRTKAEALKFRETISKNFSNSWIVQDEINYPDLKQ